MEILKKCCISTVIAIGFSIIISILGYIAKCPWGWVSNRNIVTWFLCALCFLGTFVVTFFCNIHKVINIKWLSVLFFIFVTISFFIYFNNEATIYPNNAEVYLRHKINPWVYLITILCLSSLMGVVFIKCNLNKMISYICIWGFGILTFLLSFAPNVYCDTYDALYHIHAYINSIFNVLNGAPYDKVSCSIYGHYGIIYLIPVSIIRLMGINKLYSVVVVIAMFSAGTYLVLFFVLNRFVKNKLVVIIACLASMWPILQVMGDGQYYQGYPHRIVFPILTIWLVLCVNFNNKLIKELTYVFFIALALIWNLETGFICMMALRAYDFLESNNICAEKIVKNIISEVLGIIGSIILAWIILSIYNVICGGTIFTLYDMLYPMGGASSFDFQVLGKPLPKLFSGYVFVCDIFLTPICIYLCLKMKKRMVPQFLKNMFLISLLGYGSMVYYYNRPVYPNIIISFLELVLILAILLDKLVDLLKSDFIKFRIVNCKSISLRLCAWYAYSLLVVLMTAIALAGGTSIVHDLVNRKETVWNDMQLREVREEFVKVVPDYVSGFGQGVPEFFGFCDRDNELALADWAGEDFTEESKETVMAFLSDTKEFVAEASLATDYSQLDNFDKILFCIDGYSFGGVKAPYYIGYYFLPDVQRERMMKRYVNQNAEYIELFFGMEAQDAANYWCQIAECRDLDEERKVIDEFYSLIESSANEKDDVEYIIAIHNSIFGINPEKTEIDKECEYLNNHSRSELIQKYIDSEDFYQFYKNMYFYS